MLKNWRMALIVFLFFIVLSLLLFYFDLSNKEGFNNSVIPLDIYQTWHTKELDKDMQDCVNKVKESNPEFKYHLFDDMDCAKFIKSNFEEDVYEAYMSLIPGAYKADLWRYCVLYKNGGVYLDIKYYNVNGFKFINLTDKEYFVRDIEPNGTGVYNAFIICKAGNKRLLNAINNIVMNVKNKFYGNGSLDPTGPMLLKKEFTDNEIENMRLSIGEKDCPTKTCIMLDDKPILAIYKGYYETRKTNKKSYHDYWLKKNIYKVN
jgi:mannosyltransferase OCH1-like enzyme